jgi:mutator protein MutT
MGGDSGIPSQRVQQIVLAAIVDGRGRVLIQPRAGDPTLAGTWELPGGKVRPGENHAKALAREVEEETGVAVRVGELAVALCHAYADRRVALHAYLCEPVGDARPVRWARWTSLREYRTMPMPDANVAIVDALERALPGRTAAGRSLDSDSSISYK